MKRITHENAWTKAPNVENDFPWNPQEGIMPKKPKRMGNRKVAARPRRLTRRG